MVSAFQLSIRSSYVYYYPGMLGNFNGIVEDDIMFRNGTIITDNLDDQLMHEVAQSCEYHVISCDGQSHSSALIPMQGSCKKENHSLLTLMVRATPIMHTQSTFPLSSVMFLLELI